MLRTLAGDSPSGVEDAENWCDCTEISVAPWHQIFNTNILSTIYFKTKVAENKCPILLQNENGPCSILAAWNALSLTGRLARVRGSVTAEEILRTLLLHFPPHAGSGPERRKLLLPGNSAIRCLDSDMVECLRRSHRGLCLNPRFDGTFSPSTAVELFDALQLRLVHAWVAMPGELPDDTLSYSDVQVRLATLYELKTLAAEVLAAAKGCPARAADALAQQLTADRRRNVEPAVDKENEPPRDEPPQDSSDAAAKGPPRSAVALAAALAAWALSLQSSPLAASSPSTLPSKAALLIDAVEEFCRANGAAHLFEKECSKREDNDSSTLEAAPAELASFETALEQMVSESLLEQEFLMRWPSQLTDYGLMHLKETVGPGEVAVLFRNDHFSVITQNEHGRLLQLATDEDLAAVCDWEVVVSAVVNKPLLLVGGAARRDSTGRKSSLSRDSSRRRMSNDSNHCRMM